MRLSDVDEPIFRSIPGRAQATTQQPPVPAAVEVPRPESPPRDPPPRNAVEERPPLLSPQRGEGRTISQRHRRSAREMVRDARLETSYLDGCVQHARYTADSHTGRTPQRPSRTLETWERQKELGRGTFGTVSLELCTSGDRKGMLRAVKEILKDTRSAAPIDYERELEAMIKFSHEKVFALLMQMEVCSALINATGIVRSMLCQVPRLV
jgi:hypothetical protein